MFHSTFYNTTRVGVVIFFRQPTHPPFFIPMTAEVLQIVLKFLQKTLASNNYPGFPAIPARGIPANFREIVEET